MTICRHASRHKQILNFCCPVNLSEKLVDFGTFFRQLTNPAGFVKIGCEHVSTLEENLGSPMDRLQAYECEKIDQFLVLILRRRNHVLAKKPIVDSGTLQGKISRKNIQRQRVVIHLVSGRFISICHRRAALFSQIAVEIERIVP